MDEVGGPRAVSSFETNGMPASSEFRGRALAGAAEALPPSEGAVGEGKDSHRLEILRL
jgi:hypothetical protein